MNKELQKHNHDDHCGCGHDHHHDQCGCGHDHHEHDHDHHDHAEQHQSHDHDFDNISEDKQKIYIIEGLDCANCAAKIEKNTGYAGGQCSIHNFCNKAA